MSKLGVDPWLRRAALCSGVWPLSSSTGSYRWWERIVVVLCLLDIAWIAIAFLLRPSGVRDNSATRWCRRFPKAASRRAHLFLVIAIVGNHDCAVADFSSSRAAWPISGFRFSDLKWARLDTLVGAVFTIVVAGYMVIAGNASTGTRNPVPRSGTNGRWLCAHSPVAGVRKLQSCS